MARRLRTVSKAIFPMSFPNYILEYFDRQSGSPMADQSRQSAYRSRRVGEGFKQKSFVLSPEAVEKLDGLAVKYGSATKAVEALILAADV